jgi:hypothetical protein
LETPVDCERPRYPPSSSLVEEFFSFKTSIIRFVADYRTVQHSLVTSCRLGSADFPPLSLCSSVIRGRPDDPSVSVFLFGSICTRMRLTSFCSLLITGSTAGNLGNRKVCGLFRSRRRPRDRREHFRWIYVSAQPHSASCL